MAETKIEWADYTFNHIRGCTKVSPACENCYADTMSKRNPDVLGVWGKHGTRTIAAESYWKLPERWNREAEKAGKRFRVFCASLADVFEGEDTMPENSLDAVNIARLRLFDLIERTPLLDWLLLTKRPELVYGIRQAAGYSAQLPNNVWIGTTVENQKYADIRIPELLKIPAKVRFLSVEPMLGPVNLRHSYDSKFGGVLDFLKGIDTKLQCNLPGKIDWVICGGESGSNARPMHPDWVRSIRDQCNAAGVPFLFKQNGEFVDIDTAIALGFTNSYDGKYQPYTRIPETSLPFVRVGKKNAGRLLDGREWNELPEVAR